MVIKSYSGKISFIFFYLIHVFQSLKKPFWIIGSVIYTSINNIETAIIVWLLKVLSGDVEFNPGPGNLREKLKMWLKT